MLLNVNNENWYLNSEGLDLAAKNSGRSAM